MPKLAPPHHGIRIKIPEQVVRVPFSPKPLVQVTLASREAPAPRAWHYPVDLDLEDHPGESSSDLHGPNERVAVVLDTVPRSEDLRGRAWRCGSLHPPRQHRVCGTVRYLLSRQSLPAARHGRSGHGECCGMAQGCGFARTSPTWVDARASSGHSWTAVCSQTGHRVNREYRPLSTPSPGRAAYAHSRTPLPAAPRSHSDNDIYTESGS